MTKEQLSIESTSIIDASWNDDITRDEERQNIIELAEEYADSKVLEALDDICEADILEYSNGERRESHDRLDDIYEKMEEIRERISKKKP